MTNPRSNGGAEGRRDDPSNSFDAIDVFVDGPTEDLSVGPHPAILKALLADREKDALWVEYAKKLQMEQDARDKANEPPTTQPGERG